MLQKRGEEGVVKVGEGAELHPQDMLPPVIVIGQKQSRRVTEGKFQRTDTQEEFDTLEVVPIIVRPSRTKWEAGPFHRDSRPQCWSDDGNTGSARPLSDVPALYPGRPCSSCEFYTAEPWKAKADEGWCMPGYNVLLVDAESFDIYILRLRGTSAKVARMLAAKGIFQRAVVTLSTEFVSLDTGSWYQLRSKTLRTLDEADASLVKSIAADYMGAQIGEAPTEEAMEQMEPPAPPIPTSVAASSPVKAASPVQATALRLKVTFAPQISRTRIEGRGARARLYGVTGDLGRPPVAIVAYGPLAESLMFLNPQTGDVLDCAGVFEDVVLNGAKVREFVLSKAATKVGSLGSPTTVEQDKESVYGQAASRERMATKLEAPDPDNVPF